MNQLVVTYEGDTIEVVNRLGFGRSADLSIDSNRFLHRIVGEFFASGDGWRIANRGSRLVLTVIGDDGAVSTIPPASEAMLPRSGCVRFEAGPLHYELEFVISAPPADATGVDHSPDGHTTEYEVMLTPREVDFCVTFGQARLEGRAVATPTYAQVAHRWSVSPRTVDNTMQGLKRKFRSAGVDVDAPVDSLVAHLIQVGLVTRADMEWAALDGAEPRSSLEGPRFAGGL